MRTGKRDVRGMICRRNPTLKQFSRREMMGLPAGNRADAGEARTKHATRGDAFRGERLPPAQPQLKPSEAA